MSWGEKIIQRFRRQLAAEEPMTQVDRRCARCGADMSDYAVIDDPKPTDVCEECEELVREEEFLEQWRETPPPEYDIDTILGGTERKAHEVVADLYKVFYTPCAEAKLFEPEIVIRDYCEYNQFSGSDLASILAKNQGDYFLLGGLRAMRAIGATGMVRWMEAFKKAAEEHGVVFPDLLPDPWLDHVRLEPEVEDALMKESRRLQKEIEPRKGMPFDGLDRLLVAYVRENLEMLRQRKPAGPDQR